jgi:non-heme chloroperoxidase
MSTSAPVLFARGLWIHADSRRNWSDLYRQAGYLPGAPGRPGDGETVAETRRNPAALADRGLEEITESYRRAIDKLEAAPVVIGHSFGGPVAQKLLAEGYARAAVAIDPGQIDRGHSPAFDHGRREIADHSLTWLERQGL